MDTWIEARDEKAARVLTKGEKKTVFDSQFSFDKAMSQSTRTRLVTTLKTDRSTLSQVKMHRDGSDQNSVRGSKASEQIERANCDGGNAH